jgi:hypothetical protein
MVITLFFTMVIGYCGSETATATLFYGLEEEYI